MNLSRPMLLKTCPGWMAAHTAISATNVAPVPSLLRQPGDVAFMMANARPERRGAEGAEMQTGRAIPRPLQGDS